MLTCAQGNQHLLNTLLASAGPGTPVPAPVLGLGQLQAAFTAMGAASASEPAQVLRTLMEQTRELLVAMGQRDIKDNANYAVSLDLVKTQATAMQSMLEMMGDQQVRLAQMSEMMTEVLERLPAGGQAAGGWRAAGGGPAADATPAAQGAPFVQLQLPPRPTRAVSEGERGRVLLRKQLLEDERLQAAAAATRQPHDGAGPSGMAPPAPAAPAATAATATRARPMADEGEVTSPLLEGQQGQQAQQDAPLEQPAHQPQAHEEQPAPQPQEQQEEQPGVTTITYKHALGKKVNTNSVDVPFRLQPEWAIPMMVMPDGTWLDQQSTRWTGHSLDSECMTRWALGWCCCDLFWHV